MFGMHPPINLKGLEYSVIKIKVSLAYSVQVTTKAFNYVKSVPYKFYALLPNLSFNFNFTLVESLNNFNFIFNTQPPTTHPRRKSLKDHWISA